MSRKRTPVVWSLLIVCAAWTSEARAQTAATFPDRPIRLIVPQAPGSATDNISRIVAAELGPQLGTTIVIENRRARPSPWASIWWRRPRRMATRSASGRSAG